MASTGKKGKRNKGTVVSLQSFLTSGKNPATAFEVTKKMPNINGENSDEEINSVPLVVQLPTAPRTNRVFEDHKIPTKPPYAAYITNLPFDVNEDDIFNLFTSFQVKSVRLPKEDGESGRIRGFGYIELENRDDLIQMLSLSEPSVKGRRVRIELSNEHEQQGNKRGNQRNRFDGLANNNELRNSTNWRNDISYVGSSDENATSSWRSRQKEASDSFVERQTDRFGDRQNDRYGERKNDRFVDRHNDRYGDRQNDRYGDRQNDRFIERQTEKVEERPRLNLKPRTLPLPVITVDTKENTTDMTEQVSSEIVDKFSKMTTPMDSKGNTNTVTSWRRKDEIKGNDKQNEISSSENIEKSVNLNSRCSESKKEWSPLKSPDEKSTHSAKNYLPQNIAVQSNDDVIVSNKFSGLDAEDSD